MPTHLLKATRSESNRTQNVSKLILRALNSATDSVLDPTKLAKSPGILSFTTLVRHLKTSSIFPNKDALKSNVLSYHLKRMLNAGLIQQVKPEQLPSPEEGNEKHYSYYSITEVGKITLGEMLTLNLREITEKIDNWKRNMIGRLLHVEMGTNQIAHTLEQLSHSIKTLFTTEQDPDDAAIELWTTLERLRTGTQLESTARFDTYYEVLSKELDDISQGIEEDGSPEFAEEITLILKQFIQDEEGTFRDYLQSFDIEPILTEMGKMLRRMLVSIRSAQAKLPMEKEPKRSFFRRSREEDLPTFQGKELGDLFANVYEDVRHIVKPTNKREELDLIQNIFFGMVEAMNLTTKTLNPPDKSVLMGKYMPLLGSFIGAPDEKHS